MTRQAAARLYSPAAVRKALKRILADDCMSDRSIDKQLYFDLQYFHFCASTASIVLTEAGRAFMDTAED